MKVRDVIRILKEHGFHLDRSKGGVRLFEGVVDGERRLVKAPGKDKDGDEMPKRTLSTIKRQSGLSKRLFR